MQQRMSATFLGIALVLTTPFSRLVGWAAVATLLGEDRLEGTTGQTGLGLLVLIAPAIVGGALVLAGLAVGYAPRLSDVALAIGAIGVLCLLLGIWSVVRVDGANIGGPILALAGFVLLIVSGALVLGLRRPDHG